MAQGGLCTRWAEPVTVGLLDTNFLPEASGLAVSRHFEGWLYHINDSGYGAYFYVTNETGSKTRPVRIEGFHLPRHDPEDLSLGGCEAGTCLFVGDIGDNLASREEIFVYVIPETTFGDSVQPLHRLTLRYPDGARDAESLAVHPSGDIYILSKEWRRFPLVANPARLYRLEHHRWQGNPDEVHTMTFLGSLDLPTLNRGRTTPLGHVATAMDFSEDGERLLVLTYQNALEFRFASLLDSPEELVEGEDYTVIPLRMLPQQEAVAYLPGDNAFLYNTELRGTFTEAELVRVDCLED